MQLPRPLSSERLSYSNNTTDLFIIPMTEISKVHQQTPHVLKEVFINLTQCCTYTIIYFIAFNQPISGQQCSHFLPPECITKPRVFDVFKGCKVETLARNVFINPFVPNALFLYPLKTSENRKIF